MGLSFLRPAVDDNEVDEVLVPSELSLLPRQRVLEVLILTRVKVIFFAVFFYLFRCVLILDLPKIESKISIFK